MINLIAFCLKSAINSDKFCQISKKIIKYANYANYLIKYAFYRETPGLIDFYGKNYIRMNLGTFDTPRHKILTGFPLSKVFRVLFHLFAKL